MHADLDHRPVYSLSWFWLSCRRKSQPQFQPDQNKETVAPPCDLIRKTNDTTVCGNIPVASQWSSPPHSIIQIHSLLYFGIVASMFPALLTTIGKQLLDDCAPIDVQGPVIEHSWNWQQKFNRFVALHFHGVIQ